MAAPQPAGQSLEWSQGPMTWGSTAITLRRPSSGRRPRRRSGVARARDWSAPCRPGFDDESGAEPPRSPSSRAAPRTRQAGGIADWIPRERSEGSRSRTCRGSGRCPGPRRFLGRSVPLATLGNPRGINSVVRESTNKTDRTQGPTRDHCPSSGRRDEFLKEVSAASAGAASGTDRGDPSTAAGP